MSEPQFTNDGLEIETFDEVFQRLAAGFRNIYGNEINLAYDSPDGQRVSIIAQLVLDLETFALQLYNQMDADLASGEWLNKLIKFAGIYRRPATRSQVDVEVETDRILTLPAGYAIQDDLEQRWILTAAVALPAGTTLVTFVAENFGAVEADSNTVTDPESVVLGVVSVDNPDPALPGRDEESDEELRIRRFNSVENPAYSTVGGLMSKLGDLANVTDVVVYENDQDTTDVEKDMPPHSIWVVIEGGSVDDITETMTKQRTTGCNTKGEVEGTYEEEIIRPDGSVFTITHEMTFDRPVEVPLYINLTATRTDSLSPIDLDLMKAKLASRTFRIGENVKASVLYALAYQAGDNFILSDLEISDDDMTFTDENIVSAYDGKFTLSVDDIEINEVIP